MSPQPSRIAHYTITGKLGEGGMGAVYRATDTKLNRDVAVKILPDSFAADPDRLARFTREAQVLASLNHPNIAQIYGVEERAIVMELVEGPTLEERIAQGPIPLAEALEIAGQIAGALEVAHEKGIIHRDLKPANIKLTGEGSVKVLDFGLAKAMSDEPAVANTANSPTLTMRATVAGMIMGTAAYMSPEQAAGKPADKRADIWSFGVVLWEMLTGATLFQGETTSLILADVLRAPIDFERLPKDTPAAIRRLLARCLDRNPRNRLRDIGEARIAMQNPEPPAAPAAAVRRTSWVWLAGATVVALAIGVLAGRIWKPGGHSAAPAPVRATLELTPADSLPIDGFGRPHQTAMAFSPDGSVLVFAGKTGQSLQLYKRALHQAEATPIPGTEGGGAPFFSQDGEWIGFWTGTELKKFPARGGPVTPLYNPKLAVTRTTLRGAAWGAGDRVAFADRAGLRLVSAQGGEPKLLLAADSAREVAYSCPEFLPDGKTLLYTKVVGFDWDEAEISVLPEGGTPRVLLKGGASARYSAGYLLYVRNGALMAAAMDVAGLKVTGAPAPLENDVMQSVNAGNTYQESGIAQFAVSSGGVLAYVKGGVYPPKKGSWIRVDRSGNVTDLNWAARGMYGRISPDGRQMVASVQSAASDRRARIELHDLERQTSVRLTDEDLLAQPVWSPDGRRILVNSRAKLAIMPVDGQGGPSTVLDSKEPLGSADWSHDGKFLAYAVQPATGKAQIFLKPLAPEGEPRLFFESATILGDLEFSPDGKWLAYSSYETGKAEIYVQPFPGPGEKRRISTDGGLNLAWSRDGRELFYLKQTGASGIGITTTMMAAAIDTPAGFHAGAPHALFTMNERLLTNPTRSYDVYPDGRHFLINRQTSDTGPPVARLHLIVNWLEEWKVRAPSAK